MKYKNKSKKVTKNISKKFCKITNKEFVQICKYEKNNLKKYLELVLKGYYKEVISQDGFLYAKGKDKIALTAHMDTTVSVEYGKRKPVKNVYEYIENGKHIMYSPEGIGGDDRCGVYMILEILKRTDLRPTIIFCEDEEIGLVGSRKFTKTDYIEDLNEMYFIIQLDRRGSNDLVFYEDENMDFHSFAEETTGYKENFGSCSDISNLCPACGIAGVNISCGYYNEHHDYETVNLDEMENTLNTTIALIKKGIEEKKQFEYVEHVYKTYGLNFGYRTYDDWYDDYFNESRRNQLIDYNSNEMYYLEVDYDNRMGDCGHESVIGQTLADCWYDFLFAHPNLRMTDVMDFQEMTESELFSSLSKDT